MQGDVVLTPEGRRLAEANATERRQLFKRQALANVEILRRIVAQLEAASGGRLQEDDLLARMEQSFSPEEARRKLDTAIRWGRYAGPFTYNDDRSEFHASGTDRPSPASGKRSSAGST